MATATQTLGRLLSLARDYLRRHWQGALRLRERLRLSEEAFHLLLAGGVGLLGGIANFLFHAANEVFKLLLTGHRDDLVDIARMLGPLHRVLTPALGGLAAGLVLYWGRRLLRGRGRSNLLEVVVTGDGRLPMRNAAVNTSAAVLSISTGASIGREGAVINLCATLASKLGQFAQWPPYRLRLLIACGAASGIAACYNAPIAGAVFAAQVVLGNFSMNLFAPLVVSSVMAAVVSRTFFGIQPWYVVPSFDFTRLGQLPWFLLLGVLAGIGGAGFLKALRQSEKAFQRVPLPPYGRLALAGLAVGLISIVYPEVWGNGYSATNKILAQEHGRPDEILFVVGLFAAKLLATSITVGAGTVGGVFTPTLFLGAALGSLFGELVHYAGFGGSLHTGAFALVGMAGMLAATTHSALLAMIIVFELSLNYSLMPPLMLACAISTLVARRLDKASIYTEALRTRGLDLERESPRLGAATERTVGDFMRAPVPPLRDTTPFPEIADRFLTSTFNHLPVVDGQQRLVGMVALHDLKECLGAGQALSSVIASDVMRPIPTWLTPNQKITDVLPILLASELRNVPVVDNPDDCRLVGALARSEVLDLVSEAISARAIPTME